VNMKARTIAQSKAAHVVWQLAEEASAHLLQWSRKAIGGKEWLQAREAGRGWMLLVMRAWREEVARSAGRGGGRGVGAEARRARNLGAPSQNSASFVSFRQTFGKRRSISTKNAFPVFSTSAEATKAFWHIRASERGAVQPACTFLKCLISSSSYS
jgi:hypothetical protein